MYCFLLLTSGVFFGLFLLLDSSFVQMSIVDAKATKQSLEVGSFGVVAQPNQASWGRCVKLRNQEKKSFGTIIFEL